MIEVFESGHGELYELFETCDEHQGDGRGKCYSTWCYEASVRFWGNEAQSFADWLAERTKELESFGYRLKNGK